MGVRRGRVTKNFGGAGAPPPLKGFVSDLVALDQTVWAYGEGGPQILEVLGPLPF